MNLTFADSRQCMLSLSLGTKGCCARNLHDLFLNDRASAASKLKSKIFRPKKQPTAAELAEKERKKQFREGHKQYVATGKKIAAEAKKEAKANHAPYSVKVNYHGPGYGQHGAKATKLAQKGWHDTKNLQQFKHADVS